MQASLNRGYEKTAPSSGWLILLGITLLHASLYLLWPVIKANAGYDKSNSGDLVFLNVPALKKQELPAEVKTDQKDLLLPARLRSVVSKPLTTSRDDAPAKTTQPSGQPAPPKLPQSTESAEAQSPSQSPALSSAPAAINRDVAGIFQGLKKDFEVRDRVSSKAVIPPIAKLGERIAGSSLVMREGYKHEVHILGDGRPVSKVITPFGTYCILHRKPGETIGNELATVPVTCGNLLKTGKGPLKELEKGQEISKPQVSPK
ncbi:hypothetical protein [Undibacterium sp. TJN19]|uniref:hypothetical protein n=1 Tax=Undibacterium sp. TJN19 TaxID=3413055 RepID=UPI003BF07558